MTPLVVTNPFDGRTLAELPMDSAETCRQALADAHAAHLSQRQGPPLLERRRILEAALSRLEAQSEALALQATAEGGKPLCDSRIEIQRGLEGIREAVRVLCTQTHAPVPLGFTAASSHHRSHFRSEPTGVVLGISAFNHPFNLIIHQVIPAVAAGCPVIIKPSLETPLSCLAIVKALQDSGLPQNRCRVLLCDNAVTQELATDGRVSFVTFVGSPEVGWKLRSLLAPGTRCALEHGGAAPVIIAPDFDFDRPLDLRNCAAALARASFTHAGQVCISAQRLFVPKAHQEAFLGALVTETERLVCGDPLLPETVVGPLIRPTALARVEEWVNEALSQGARCVAGGSRQSATVYRPTILVDPPHQAKVSQREVFGPVVCVYGYDNLDQAIRAANDTPYCFHASVFTPRLATAEHLINALDATCVLVNEHPAFRVDWMPFGGRRLSGLGQGGIAPSIAEMSAQKLVIQRLQES